MYTNKHFYSVITQLFDSVSLTQHITSKPSELFALGPSLFLSFHDYQLLITPVTWLTMWVNCNSGTTMNRNREIATSLKYCKSSDLHNTCLVIAILFFRLRNQKFLNHNTFKSASIVKTTIIYIFNKLSSVAQHSQTLEGSGESNTLYKLFKKTESTYAATLR